MKKILGLIGALAAIMLPLGALASEVPAVPVGYYGSVRIEGVAAPVGAVVTASVNNAEVASYTLREAGSYAMNISQSEVAVNSVIQFKVNGKAVADPAGAFRMMDVSEHSRVQYDLSVVTNTPSGGGSGSRPTPKPEEKTEVPETEGTLGGDEAGQVLGATSVEVRDGDIIQCRNSANPNAVYIVKMVGEKKFIRHIVSLEIFNFYAHLKWENLIQVETLDGFSLSGWVRVNTGANGQPGPSDKVYEINGDQTRHWIDMTAAEFLQHGGSEEAIYAINQGELNLYREGPAVKLM